MKLKITTEEYNKQLDIIALESLKCILAGVYSNPIILAQLGEMADINKVSVAQEIAERSYVMAQTMLKWRNKFTAKDEGSNNDNKR